MSSWRSNSHSTISSYSLIVGLMVRSRWLRVNRSNSCRSVHHVVRGGRSLTLLLLECLAVVCLAAYRSCNVPVALLLNLLLLHWSTNIVLGAQRLIVLGVRYASCLWIVFIGLSHLLLGASGIIIIWLVWRRDSYLGISLGIGNAASIVMMLLLNLYLFRSRSRSLLAHGVVLTSISYLFFLAACSSSVNMSGSMTASRMTNNCLMLVYTGGSVRFVRFVLLTWLSILIWVFLIWLLLIWLSILVFHQIVVTWGISPSIQLLLIS